MGGIIAVTVPSTAPIAGPSMLGPVMSGVPKKCAVAAYWSCSVIGLS